MIIHKCYECGSEDIAIHRIDDIDSSDELGLYFECENCNNTVKLIFTDLGLCFKYGILNELRFSENIATVKTN